MGGGVAIAEQHAADDRRDDGEHGPDRKRQVITTLADSPSENAIMIRFPGRKARPTFGGL